MSRSSTPPPSRLSDLRVAHSLRDVARLLGLKPSSLSYLLYKYGDDKKYTTFQVPKRNGGHRTIKAPVKRLKVIQRKLSDLLQDCVDEINKEKHRRDISAQGFKRNRSILTNARRHRHRKFIFNVDLEDFFPTINFGRVRGFFIKNRDFELHKDVATVIAQIACHDHTLPQGSPCSPVISNLVANLLDVRLVRLASSAGATYTRYADDLTFSSNKRDFPPEIAVAVGPHSWQPSKALRVIIERTGFTINDSKTHMMYRRSRQEVTGLIVNKRVNIRCEYRRTVRAMVHRLVTTGSFDVQAVSKDGGIEERPGTLNELHGMLGFINSIDVFNRDKTPDGGELSLIKKELSYRQFLLYSHFYANETAVVICEGETDNVYLTHAIRSLAKDFPDLAEIKKDGTIRLKVRLYKYPQTSTARILGLKDGGTSHLSDFLLTLKKHTDRFTAPGGLAEPVIILYDNDAGADPIRSVIRNKFKVKLTDDEPYVHVFKNVYALGTPKLGGATRSTIEDFFRPKTKAIVHEGKTFNDAKDADKAKHFGKRVFAHQVVRPNANTIDFTDFKPLLTSIVAAIRAHKTPPPTP